jgi:hypothetical protein
MSKPTLIIAGLLLLAFGSGLGCGLFFGSASSDSTASTRTSGSSSSGFFSSSEAQNQVQANTLLSDRIRELEKELAEQKKGQDFALADRLAFFKKYRAQFILMGPFGFGGDLKLSPALAELLGLSKEEQEVVEQHLAETKSEMNALEKSKAVVVKQSENSVTFEIPAAPEGADIKAKLDGLLSGDIGDDRADLLESYFQYNTFGGFTEQKRRIEISWTEQNGNPEYTYQDNFLGPNGKPMNGSGGGGTLLSPEYQMLLQSQPAP